MKSDTLEVYTAREYKHHEVTFLGLSLTQARGPTMFQNQDQLDPISHALKVPNI